MSEREQMTKAPPPARDPIEEAERLFYSGDMPMFKLNAIAPVLFAKAREVKRLREALLRLANAADHVGVKFFDTDTMEPEVEELQEATMAARAALAQEKEQ